MIFSHKIVLNNSKYSSASNQILISTSVKNYFRRKYTRWFIQKYIFPSRERARKSYNDFSVNIRMYADARI